MKKFLSYTKTFIVLLIVTAIFLSFYAYMLARPISYGMGYLNRSAYEGVSFEGTMKFYTDNTMVVESTNFDEKMEYFYYYKDGYLFSTVAMTEEEYEVEVAYINDNFEEAIKSPFYATKINAFRQVAEGIDGYTMIYTCTSAITFAAVGGVVALILVALTVCTLILSKKSKCAE